MVDEQEKAKMATFYVYHKVKGDRIGGPDYALLDTFDDKAKAEAFADCYNQQHGYRKTAGFHCAVVRTRKVKEN
jgi:hypothetical protein